MLRCGQDWQPTSIDRVVQSLETSTRCVRTVTDQGTAFIKGQGNPAGAGALAAELVAAELAAWFGLVVPDFAIIQIAGLPIPMVGSGDMLPGPAFASRLLPGGADVGPVALSKLAVPADVSRLVLFDTWIRNGDRYPPVGSFNDPNYDNLFFMPLGHQFRIVALDHSHAFVEGGLEDEIGLATVRHDARVFGMFPEFKPYMVEEHIVAGAVRLTSVEASFVDEIIASIPGEWGPSASARKKWATMIYERAMNVAALAPALLLEQGQLGL